MVDSEVDENSNSNDVQDTDAGAQNTPATDEPTSATPNTPPATANAVNRPTSNRFRRLGQAYWRKKRLTLPATIIVLLAVLFLIPATRYPLLGLVIKKNFSVVVLDETSKKPVTKTQLQLGSTTVRTDSNGRATIRAKVGRAQLVASKKYYKSATVSVLVPLSQKHAPFKVFVQATGRQVPVTVTNKISGKPIAGALLTAAGTEVKTDKDGKATIVLPADKSSVAVTISLTGFNPVTSTLQVTELAVPQNSFQLVSSGKLYFLSKLSGKVDVVKTNLDGSDRQTVLAGTGKEISTDTILLASRDWKYLALKSQRDGGANAKLFLIDTSIDKLTTMDEGKAYFEAIGWADHRFVYKVGREGIPNWQSKGQALKSYDAAANKLTIIDETSGEGTSDSDYAFNLFGTVYLLGNEIVYNKNWNSSYYGGHLNGKQVSLVSAQSDGSGRKTIKDFAVPANQNYYSIDLRLYTADELYVQVPGQNGGGASYFEYAAGKIAGKTDVSDQDFNAPYPTFLASPSGKQTLWSEARDGKNTVFVGDSSGTNGKQIATLSEYAVYGWYTDDYLLVSKNSSELYIMPVAGGTPLKVSDYHKPDYNFRGYGGGYGGL